MDISGIVKHTYKTLTLINRWEVIKNYDRGETSTAISKVFDIRRLTVYDRKNIRVK